MTASIGLREVRDSDLQVFFEHQMEPEAVRMAAFPSRGFEPFMAHWARIRADPKVKVRAILVDGNVAGNICSWEQDGKRFLGYWVGRAFWGKGAATLALAAFLSEDSARPLYARVAKDNLASIRVLEKNGLMRVGEEKGVSIMGGPPVDEFLYATGLSVVGPGGPPSGDP